MLPSPRRDRTPVTVNDIILHSCVEGRHSTCIGAKPTVVVIRQVRVDCESNIVPSIVIGIADAADEIIARLQQKLRYRNKTEIALNSISVIYNNLSQRVTQ